MVDELRDLQAFYRLVGAAEEIDLSEELDADRAAAFIAAHRKAITEIARVIFGEDPDEPADAVPDEPAEPAEPSVGKPREPSDLSYGQVVGMLEHELGAEEVTEPPEPDVAEEP